MPVYGLKYRSLGQASYYSGPPGLEKGALVCVETDQGQTLARVVSCPSQAVGGSLSEASLPAILRLADEEDRRRDEANGHLAREAWEFCRECVRRHGLDMKLVDVEVFFDRSKIVFYFTAPSRIDFRGLVKDLVRQYRARIELRQVGVRHETQMVGAVGNCGMVCCCRRFLRKFAPVTIRMAKEQNLFLNPAKISGICGRLLCCLAHEQENYDQFHRSCPRLGKRYQTDRGTMKVLRTNLFRSSVAVLTETGEEQELTLEEWQALSPHRPEAAKQAAPKETARPQQGGGGLLVVAAAPDAPDGMEVSGVLRNGAGGSGCGCEEGTTARHACGEAGAGRRKRRHRPPRGITE